MPDTNKKKRSWFSRLLRKIRGIFGLNIATVMFTLLLIYMTFSSVLYITSGQTESYQVIAGPLSRNETYTGLAIREETVNQAESNGYITYFAREGNKINANGAVYGISSTQIPEVETELSQENLSRIRSQMLSFSKGFIPSNFNSTYSFKYELEGNILQYAGVTSNTGEGSDEADSSVSTVMLGNQTISKARADGIILYSMDGYEGKTVETVTAEDFDQNSYHETDLKTKKPVKAGENVYTIITDERWSLLIPLSTRQAVKLEDRTVIRVKFLKDNMTQSGDFSIIEIDGNKYGRIDFNKGLIRYASDRFLEIELVTNTVSGLKIPLTSIVTKEFYTIPSRFATTDSESGDVGFMVTGRDGDGQETRTFVNATIYASEEIPRSSAPGSGRDETETQYLYYVNKTEFKEGDAIVNLSDQSRYIVGDVGVLEGVYCINQGYAVFRRIQILDQNEEYAIISRNTSYGLARYDHIVKNADKVREEDILY